MLCSVVLFLLFCFVLLCFRFVFTCLLGTMGSGKSGVRGSEDACYDRGNAFFGQHISDRRRSSIDELPNVVGMPFVFFRFFSFFFRVIPGILPAVGHGIVHGVKRKTFSRGRFFVEVRIELLKCGIS